MNESQLVTFLTVAQYKSYSKAAIMLEVTQPTITSRIKTLEEILDCSLFERNGHEIILTREGELFTDYAHNILSYMDYSREIPKMLKNPSIKIGFTPGYSYSFITEVLKTIQAVKDIDIQIIEGHDSVSLNERALAGEIDLIFTREILTNTPDITSEYLFDNNLVCVLPSDHRLSNKHILSTSDLKGETVLSYKRNSTLWRMIDKQLLGAKNITRVDVDNNEMLLKAVEDGIGIGIIPRLGIDNYCKPEIAVRKITEIDNIPNKVYVQYRETSQMKGIAKKVIYAIINHRYSAVT
ncbi:DNA-binding transcriptional regulator, LysR family [Lentibacillus persicus]|uniref:DNA-binding transcriptional regulator, LysR family n=1 Tax=Lentibacillus persicus TaxID=640948 RepID=A0A1I1S6H4_9BACI|nr:LysR family transcriptional regulator [Lentibacillus persicus]SFD39423.1 DNA-binding transcriptional regulator, LysR family [Lentibacillus persicus]